MEDELKIFIEGNGLHDAIIAQLKMVPYGATRLVTYSNECCMVIVGGPCPCCSSSYIRNTCATQYVKHCVAPVLMSRFKIKSVSFFPTYLTDFESHISRLRGLISYNIKAACIKHMTFAGAREFMMNRHPNVSCTVKMTVWKDNTQKISEDETVSFEHIMEKCEFNYFIDKSMTVMCKDGKMLSGDVEILQNHQKIVGGLYLRMVDGGIPVLTCNDWRFYSNRAYVVVNFD